MKPVERSPVSLTWGGELDDDCTAESGALVLRAEWMYDDIWWWAVYDGQKLVASSTVMPAHYKSGAEARDAAEQAIVDYLAGGPKRRELLRRNKNWAKSCLLEKKNRR